MPRFFWQSKGKPKNKGPENEGPMIELQDMTGFDPDKSLREAEEKKRKEAVEAARKKAADEKHKADRKKAGAELEFASSLYDSTDVKEAGKKAFSKISTLLVRYNRLKDIKSESSINAREAREEENRKYQRELAALNAAEEELKKSAEEGGKDEDEKDRNEELKKIAENRRNLRIRHQKALAGIDKKEGEIDEEDIENLDRDTGGIRSALMLGGKTSAGMGYTFTAGSQADIIKARNYIDEQAGADGSLMAQMSLLDNAVNTGGVDLETRKKGTTEGIAHANLSQILANMTAADVAQLNSGKGEKLNIDMTMLEESQKDQDKMKALFGEKKQMDSIRTALEKRGGAYVEENSLAERARNNGVGLYNRIKGGLNRFSKVHPVLGHLSMAAPIGALMNRFEPRKRKTLKLQGLTPEAMARATGKAGSYSDPEKAKKIIDAYKGKTGIMTGFLPHGEYIERRLQAGTFSSPAQRREAIRKEREALFRSIGEKNSKKGKEAPAKIQVNSSEKFNKAMQEIRSNDASSLLTRTKTGELTSGEAQSLAKLDDIDFILSKRSEGEKDSNATHMLATYKLLGASLQELLDFRLALIAYMVPSGKKTVAEIVNESHDAGVVGAEGPDKISEDTDMEKLFSQLRRRADYVERLKEKEKGIEDYKWTVDKKKFKKTENGPVEAKEEEKKEEEVKKEEEEEEYKGPVHIFGINDDQFKNGVAGGQEEEDEPLFGPNDEIKTTDIRVKGGKNSFLMAALTALAVSDPDYIRKKLVVENEDKKTVNVRLFGKNGTPVWYRVSKKRVNGGTTNGPLWVNMVEKAASVMLADTGNGVVGYREDIKNEEDRNNIAVGDMANGSEELAMKILLGENRVSGVSFDEVKSADGKEDDKAKGKTVIDSIAEARKNGRIITATTYDSEKIKVKNAGKIMALNALKPMQTYAVTGKGFGIGDEASVKLRDVSGPVIIETIYRNGKKVEKITDDSEIEIPVSAFLKCFPKMTMGDIGKKAPVKEEGNKEEPPKDAEAAKEEDKKEELIGINEALVMMGAGEGVEIIDKWKELGNRLWKAAYVEMGKGGLEVIMQFLDELITYLTEPLPLKLDDSNANFVATRTSIIETKYKTIVYEAAELAHVMAEMGFEGSDEAAAAAVALSNQAIVESRYFVRGCNIVADKLSGEGYKDKKVWLEMVLKGKAALSEEETKEAQKRRKEQEEQAKREGRINLFDDEPEEEDEDESELQAADELPEDAGRNTEYMPAKEPFADKGYFDEEPEGEVQRPRKRRNSLSAPVKRMSIPDETVAKAEEEPKVEQPEEEKPKEEPKVEKPREVQAKEEEQAEEKPEEAADAHNRVTLPEKEADLEEVVQAAPPKKEDKKTAGPEKTQKIPMKEEAAEINRREKAIIFEPVILEKGKKALFDDEEEEADGDLQGDDEIRRVDAKKDLTAEEKEAEKGAGQGQRLETEVKGPGKKKQPLVILEKEKAKEEEKAKEKAKEKEKGGLFDDAEPVEMDAASYISLWRYFKNRFADIINEVKEPKGKSTAVAELKKKKDMTAKTLNSFVSLLDGDVTAAGNKKLFETERKQIDFSLKYIDTMCADFAFMVQDNDEAAKVLLRIAHTAVYMRQYIRKGAEQEAGNKKIELKKWADILVMGKNTYDKEMAKKAAAGQKAAEDVQEEKLPIVDADAKKPQEKGKNKEKNREEEQKLETELERLEKETEPEDEEAAFDTEQNDRKLEEIKRNVAQQNAELQQDMEKEAKAMEENAEELEGKGKKLLDVIEGKKEKDEKKVPAKKEADEGRQQEEKAKEKQALDKGAQIVGKQSFVPISRGEKAKNRIVSAAKYIWGAGMLPVNLVVAGISKLFLLGQKKKRKGNEQENRDKENRTDIAGRSKTDLADRKAPTDKNGNVQVYDDVTTVPLVWEFITAGDAEEAPEMSINVDQPAEGKTKTSSGTDVGHTFISLTYSRVNASTRKKERYKLEYGFYPKDGFNGLGLTMNQGMKAVIPGMLKDDKGHDYSISKRYNITTEKVNEVLKASEHYSNRGYNIFTRNCTTFAVEMGRTAGIPIADKIEASEFDLGNAARIGSVFLGGFAPSSRYTAEIDFEKNLSQEDLKYENFGQRLGTVEEINRYKSSRELLPHTPKGFSPAVAGETIRRDESGEGILGANKDLKDISGNLRELAKTEGEVRQRIKRSFTDTYKLLGGDKKMRRSPIKKRRSVRCCLH